MEIEFWYSDIVPGSSIRDTLEKIDVSFKNIDTDLIESTKLNFLVFSWETYRRYGLPNTSYTHSEAFISILNKLQTQNFYFIGDYTGEAHNRVDKLSISFLNKLKSIGVDINRLIVANNNSNKTGIHKVRYESYLLNICFFPNFFLSTYNYLNRYVKNLNSKVEPTHKFLCLNRRMYYHKYQIIEELFHRGLLDDTLFTWVDNRIPANKLNKELISKIGLTPHNFKSIQLEDDIMYGSELSSHDEFLYTINPQWYYKSKVNIITETILDEDEIHITEKTWKAIYLGVPFVISASNGHLKTLRDMGFKTFNSVINEDYDNMRGRNKIKQIIDSAVELSNLYNTKEVLDICRYNQQLYFNMEHRKQIYKELFLDKLYDIDKITQSKSLI